jgi:hypothetical protein
MKHCLLIISFLVLLCTSCISRRLGKTKLINSEVIKKTDSVIFIRPFYSYGIFGNQISGGGGNEKRNEQTQFEFLWDSIQQESVKSIFKAEYKSFGIRGQAYDERPFNFRQVIGIKYMKADTSSYLLSRFTWNIRAGKKNEAMQYLPVLLKEMSYDKPVIIITNAFEFYEIEFQAYYASGSTGLNFIPDCLVAIVYKGEIQYYRNYTRRYKFERIQKNPKIIYEMTLNLFDKVN